MDAQRWEAIQRLFSDALAQPTAERSRWLAEACGDDEVLHHEVSSLLRADAEAGESIAAAVRGGEELILEPPPPDEAPTQLATGHGRSDDPAPAPGPLADSDSLPPGTAPIEAAPATGWRFGKYEVSERLGQGGFGVVYRGHDPVLRRDVAIKTCPGIDPGLRRRFFREGQIAAGLEHPNIVTVFELGVEAGVPYLVQELLGGHDLRELMPPVHEEDVEGSGHSIEPLGLERRLDILLQVARGLGHAHRAGVLHRDVKPANIRVLDDGRVKLLDFGIAKLLDADSQLTGTGTTLGTVGYLAPEQLRSEPLDGRADIFAFGVVAYELLGGRRPFRGQDFSQVSYQLLYVEPEALEALWPACPPALAELVQSCLAKDPAERPARFEEVTRILEALIEDLKPIPMGHLSQRPIEGASDSRGIDPGGSGLTERVATSPEVLDVRPPTGPSPTDDDLPTLALERPSRGRSKALGLAAAIVLAVSMAALWPRDAPQSPPAEGQGESTAEALPPAAASEVPSPSDPEDAGSPPASGEPEHPSAAEGSTPTAVTIPEVDAGTDPSDDAEKEPGTSREADSAPFSQPPEQEPDTPDDTEQEPGTSHAPEQESGTFPTEITGATTGVTPRDAEPEQEPGTFLETTATASEGGEMGTPLPLATLPEQEPGTPSTDGEATPLRRAPMTRGELITEGGPGVEPPRLEGNFDPIYPRRAHRLGREARVVVKVLVDENGRALQAIAPADEHGFGEAARRAALEARFAPATREGVEGKMWMNLPFEFRLD